MMTVIKPVSNLRLKKNNSDLVDITTSYGYDIYNADATVYGHFHDCVTSSTCKYALVQEVDNAAQMYYRHQGQVLFIYAMGGVGSVSFDNNGPFSSPEAKLSRSSGSFGYIQIMLKDDWSSTNRVVGESSLSEFPLASTNPTSGTCSDLWAPGRTTIVVLQTTLVIKARSRSSRPSR